MSAPLNSNNNNGLDFKTVYDQVCNSYRAVDDFRAKLLGFLPLATGTGILVLYNTLPENNKTGGVNTIGKGIAEVLGPIGILGFVITLGLFVYEIYGIRKCHDLIKTGQQLESNLGIEGQFRKRKATVAGFLNEPFADAIIYPAVLAAWAYAALLFTRSSAALAVASGVFIIGFAITFGYELWLLYGDGRKFSTSVTTESGQQQRIPHREG
jgi:hypothetical protein